MLRNKVLKAILVPATKKEIAKSSGLTEKQVTQVFRDLNAKGIEYQTMGHHSHTHYYLPEYLQRKQGLGAKFLYKDLLDLIDTEEWWTMEEICIVLEAEPREVGNKVRYINRKGYANITVQRYNGNATRYMVVRSK
ncbi:hypothetical protein VPHD292_0060 [Vibrio phage D292]